MAAKKRISGVIFVLMFILKSLGGRELATTIYTWLSTLMSVTFRFWKTFQFNHKAELIFCNSTAICSLVFYMRRRVISEWRRYVINFQAYCFSSSRTDFRCVKKLLLDFSTNFDGNFPNQKITNKSQNCYRLCAQTIRSIGETKNKLFYSIFKLQIFHFWFSLQCKTFFCSFDILLCEFFSRLFLIIKERTANFLHQTLKFYDTHPVKAKAFVAFEMPRPTTNFIWLWSKVFANCCCEMEKILFSRHPTAPTPR